MIQTGKTKSPSRNDLNRQLSQVGNKFFERFGHKIPNDFDFALTPIEMVPSPFHLGLFRRIWMSPIFQKWWLMTARFDEPDKKAVKSYNLEEQESIKRIVRIWTYILAGLFTIGVVASVITYFVISIDATLRIFLITLTILLIGGVVPVTLFYLGWFLMHTPARFRRMLNDNETDPLLCTPLTDEEIFYSECNVGQWTRGVHSGYLFIAIMLVANIVSGLGRAVTDPGFQVHFQTSLNYFMFLLFIIVMPQPVYIYTSAMYAQKLGIIETIFASLLHIFLLVLVGFSLGLWEVWLYVPMARSSLFFLLFYSKSIGLYISVLLLISTLICSKLGFRFFKQGRRQ